MAYATDDDARDFYAGADAEDIRVEVTVRQAARLVQHYAPVPTIVPTDYAATARDAELMLGEYLWETGGYKTSTSVGVGGLSTGGGFANLDTMKKMITQAMGTYADAGPPVPIVSPRRSGTPYFVNSSFGLYGPFE